MRPPPPSTWAPWHPDPAAARLHARALCAWCTPPSAPPPPRARAGEALRREEALQEAARARDSEMGTTLSTLERLRLEHTALLSVLPAATKLETFAVLSTAMRYRLPHQASCSACKSHVPG